MPVSQPKLPAVLPRWDDIATVVVALAAQTGLLAYRPFAGTANQSKATGLLRPNIRAANGSGPAYLASEAFPVFLCLGMILDGRWTEIAETIFWRDFPAWDIDFTVDHRFVAACNTALASVPNDIAAEIKGLATVSEEDINEWLELVNKRAPTPKTRADALKSLHFWACHGLDGIFHRQWRLSDGWLSAEEKKRTLFIQHDPVAINMRCEFMSRYLPGSPISRRVD
jgi:pellino protein